MIVGVNGGAIGTEQPSLIVPHPYKVSNAAKSAEDEEFFAAAPEDRAKSLPRPQGFQILCAIPDAEDEYESGLAKADITKQHDELMSLVLFVVDMGPTAYADETRFPHGAYCKKGDFVLTRPMAGVRVKIHGREFRLINDDSVLAVVDDPRGITRA